MNDDEINQLWRIIRKQDELIAAQQKTIDWAAFVIETATQYPEDWKSRVVRAMAPERRGTYWIDYMEAALKDFAS